jgi:hypothetical protein
MEAFKERSGMNKQGGRDVQLAHHLFQLNFPLTLCINSIIEF